MDFYHFCACYFTFCYSKRHGKFTHNSPAITQNYKTGIMTYSLLLSLTPLSSTTDVFQFRSFKLLKGPSECLLFFVFDSAMGFLRSTKDKRASTAPKLLFPRKFFVSLPPKKLK